MQHFLLKDYQQRALDSLSKFNERMRHYIEAGESDYQTRAWGDLYPTTQYHKRFDGLGDKTENEIPNVCIQIPTGGGKTLLATHALAGINAGYFKRHTGLVLWIVPNTSIYGQTLKALKNRHHPYRHQLEVASGGAVRIFERENTMNKSDVKHNLCVMVLTLQSFNIARENKDKRRLFRDSGYSSFFPKETDNNANKALIKKIPNLVEADLVERMKGMGVDIAHSLGNVFRICRPIIILDEMHRAKTKKAVENINRFNPGYILELSATPDKKFNLVASAGAMELKQEQMIRLPIVVDDIESQEWKATLDSACAKLTHLSKDADKLDRSEQTYIRPIMIIAAPPKKPNDPHNIIPDIKKYLMTKHGIPEYEIAIKVSDKDELAKEDLLSKKSLIKYIITKEALNEGWDCSFAYVLALLSKREKQRSMIQLLGRVMRQPYARQVGIESLNKSYVFCSFGSVSAAIQSIKTGLEKEGLKLGQSDVDEEDKTRTEKVIQKRKAYSKDIFIPQLSTVIGKNKSVPFDYYRDILSDIDWKKFIPVKITKRDIARQAEMTREIIVDFSAMEKDWNYGEKSSEELAPEEHNPSYARMVGQISEKIPNPFEAKRILDDALPRNMSGKVIARHAMDMVGNIKKQAQIWLENESEARFVEKLKAGKISLRLLASSYEIKKELEYFRHEHETSYAYQKSLFDNQYPSAFNKFERVMASYIDGRNAVKWWHRLGISKTDWSVQGWRKDKIYPDFLVYKNKGDLVFVETKGDHLDASYKEKVFNELNSANQIKVGEFNLTDGEKTTSFVLKFQSDWELDRQISELEVE